MDIIKANIIKGVVSFLIGLIIIINVINVREWSVLLYLTPPTLRFFITPPGLVFLDLFFLAIILFLYAYFMIRPIKTLKGKKNLTIIAMIFGGVFVVFPLIGIGYELSLSTLIEFYLDNLLIYYIFGMVLYLICLMPGIILFTYSWYLRGKLRIENNS